MRIFFTLVIFLGLINQNFSQVLKEKAACANPIPINFTVTITSNYNGQAISCNGACDGEITVTVNSSGGGPFGFELFDGNPANTIIQSSNVFTNLCANNYNVTVYDSSQLIFGNFYESCTEFGVIITPPNNIGVNVLGFQDPTCPDSCDGRIFANIGGGTAPLSILWLESGSTISSPTGVCTGPNTVEVTDANGCFFTTIVTVNDPVQINFGMMNQAVSCDGICDAQAFSAPSGSNGGPFTFDWSELPGSNPIGNGTGPSFLQSGLCENTSYQLMIEDVNGCPFDTTITIEDAIPISLTESGLVDATCPNSCDGQLTVNLAGGSGTFTNVEWYEGTIGTGVLFDAGPSLSQNTLCPNTDYYVSVTDDQGCTREFQLSQVGGPPPFNFSETHADVNCNGNQNGFINITLLGGTPNYNFAWSSSDGGTGFNPTSEDQSGLSGGTYQVIWTDNLNCVDSAEIIILEPEPIFTNGIVTNVSCFDQTDASIDITTSGGNGGYTWTWTQSANGNIGDPSLEDQTGLDSATYNLNITDALGCPYDTTIIINKPGEIFFNADVTQMLCFGDNDAIIELNPDNGVPNYTINWGTPINQPNGPTTQNNLSGGSYNINLVDANGCDKDTLIEIIEPPLLAATETHIDISCFGFNDGEIEVLLNGGTPPYRISWSGGSTVIPGITENNPTNLGPGTYTASIEDANACTITIDITIDEPDPLTLDISGTDLTCNGVPNGEVFLTNISGGVVAGNYLFDWDNDGTGDFDDTQDLNNLLAGTYCVNIQDDNGCTLAADSCFTIIEPDSIFFNGSTFSDISCFGANDGSVNLNVTGGTEAGNYDFLWNPVPGCYVGSTTAQNISNLCEGTYIVTATDDNGCTNDTIFQVVEPDELNISATQQNIDCFGANNGEINVSISGGSAPLTVTWTSNTPTTPAQDDLNPTNLEPGSYIATVTDANNCNQQTVIDLTEPNILSLTITGTDLTCNGVPDGTVSIVPSGGTVAGNYSYDWDNDGSGDFDDNQNLVALLAGTYCVNIQDDNGCTLAADSCFTIIEPDSIFFAGSTFTDMSCFGTNDASVNISVSGGTVAADYGYTWNPVPGCYGGPTNIANINNLCEGSYTLTASDDNGCTNDTTFVVTEPDELTISTSSTNTGCGVNNGTASVTISGGTPGVGYIISWTGPNGFTSSSTSLTGLETGVYDVTVTDANGCSVVGQEVIGTITPPIITIDNQTDLLCNTVCSGSIQITVSGGVAPYNISWAGTPLTNFSSSNEDVFGLCADDYTLIVTDANLCQEVMVITITEPLPIELDNSTVTNVDCFGNATGAINITPIGGTVAGNYSYSWSGDNSFSSINQNVNGLLPGTYCVDVIDDNGCSFNADSCFVITEPTELSIDNLSSTDAQCNVPNGSVSVVASGGSVLADYSYSWVSLTNPAPPGNVGTTATVNNVLNDTYTVTVTDDNGCTVDGSVSVQPTNGPAVTIDNISDVTCAGASNGSISTTSTGGTGTLTYSWSSIPAGLPNPNPGDVSNLFGIPGGTYVVIVTDGAACNTQQVVVINEPTPITITSNITDANCFGENGLIDITVSGGTVALDYGYDWDHNGGATFNDSQDLSFIAGTYNVSVIDDNSCVANFGPFTINEPSEITLTTSSTQSACLVNNGTVSVVASNGTPGNPPNEYLYVWTDVNATQVGNAATASNLFAGCYDVTVTENRPNGCSVTTTECVSDINGPTLTETFTNPTCNSGSDGEILLDVVSPIGGVTFVWTALNGSAINPNNTSEDLSGIEADEYSVVATDANGCVTGLAVILTEPDAIDVTTTISSPLCSSSMDGSITIDVINNAVLPIASTNWTGPNGFNSATQNISGLAIGQYCLTIIDALGCQLDTCFTLTAPNGITISTSSLPTNCNAPTGQVSVTANGGIPAYSIDWTGPGGPYVGNIISGLDVGNYTVVVTDQNGCTATSVQSVAASNAPVVSVDNVNDVDCFGNATGSIFVSVSGGVPNYTYDWDNLPGANNPEDQTNLPAGTYTLVVTDNAGCSTPPEIITIDQPLTPLTIVGTTTDLLCFGGGTGEIDAVVSGGTPNYSYTWSESGNIFATSSNGTGLSTVTGLDALTYELSVSDANGCIAIDNFTLTEETEIILTVGNIDASCGNSDGEISVTAIGGNDGITYNYDWIDFNTGINVGNTATVNGLPQGTYQVDVTDLNGCTATDFATISDVGGPDVVSTSTDVFCFGDANGNIDITVTGNPNFNFSWNGPNGFNSTQEDLTGLEAGNYILAVTDVNGCVTNDVVLVSGPNSALAVSGIETNLNCFEDASGEVDITITGGTPNYVVSWSGPNGFNAAIQDINGLEEGTYTVDITDNNGCQLNGNNFVITQPDEITLTTNISEPSCGLSDGSLTVNVIGGTVATDYNYVWTDINQGVIMPDSDNDITNIDAGNYEVVITDDNGCNVTEVVSVSNDQAPDITVVETNVDCFGNTTGTINITVNETPPNTYTFDWDIDGIGDFDDTQNLANLGAGTYNLTVLEDPTGCISVASATITEPDALNLTSNASDLLCYNDNTGGLDITVTGGTTPYNFNWDNLPGTNNPEDQPNINAGTYQVTVTDNNGCVIIDAYTITEPLEIDITAIITNNNCFGDAQGAIDVTVADGVAPYQFSWDTGTTNEDESLLSAGNYLFTVTDNNGCTRDSLFTVTEPDQIIFDATVVDANCNLSDGDITTNVSGGTLTSPDYTYDWQFGGNSIASTADILSQPAGTYTFFVTDDNLCTADTTVSISNINAPTITVDNIVDVTCFGDNDGQINVTINGGTAPYTYVWNPNGISQQEDLTNAEAGTYILEVTDAAGCIAIQGNLTINTPSALSATITENDATCGLCNGSATVSGTGGSGNYSYVWSSGNTGSNESNLCAGVYTVAITDVAGCSINENVTINNIGGPTGEIIVSTDASCGGGNDGTATVNATGGVAPYTYFWPHNGSTNATQNNLSTGTYFVEMTDDNSCIRIAQVDIQEPTSISISSVINPSTCLNADGDITITTSGGVAPLSINWTNPAGQTTPGVSGLSAGVYSVVVSDNNGCSVSQNFTISDINAPQISLSPSDVLCNGDATGSITSITSGAVGVMDYQWLDAVPSPIFGETNDNIQNISTGTYTLQGTDAGTGCITLVSATLSEPSDLILSIPNTVDASCNISCDGQATAIVSGGTLAYSYLWNNGETTATATSLCVGVNNVIITDANGCEIQQTILIEENFQLAATVVPTDATCGDCNGQAVVTPTGGSGNYNILWSDGSTGLSNTGLCAGLYPFDVTDQTTGCNIQLDATINNIGGPTGETINSTDVTCNNGNDGAAQVFPTGGVTPYNYVWLGQGNTTNQINGVSAGTYNLQVSDANGCIRMVPVSIEEPDAPNVQSIINDGTCGNADGSITLIVNGGNGPFTYNWISGPSAVGSTNDTETGLLPGVYVIEITDVAGCVYSQNISLGTTNGPALAISNTNENCFGSTDGSATVVATGNAPFTYLWTSGGVTDTETGLSQGQYFVSVTDDLGCVTNASVNISSPDELILGLPNIQDASCDIACDGTASLIVSGGTVNYSFAWSGGQTTQTATGLCVGVNNVTITDANGCETQTSVIVDFSDNLTSTVVPNDAACGECDGDASVTPSGGSGNYTITWFDNTTGLSHNNLCAGIYPYTVTDNANGCQSSLNVTINNIGGPDDETIIVTDVTCLDGNDGSATVTPSGGTAPYQLLWVPTGQTTNTLSNVPAGTYNLEVTDANNCIRVVPVTISEPNGMDIQFIANGANCNSSDGAITLVVSNGVTPINYSWTGPGGFTSSNSSESNLAAGLYTVILTDNAGCSQVANIPLSSSTPPQATVNGSDVSCFGLSDGSLTAVGAGLDFEWEDGTIGANFNGLSSGQYFVTVTDPITGCISVSSGIVNEPDSIALGVQFAADPLCNGDCNGELSAIADGGTLPYTYTWSSSANTTYTETGLCDGTTTLTITDVNGCNTSTDVTLTEPTVITIVVDNVVDATCVNSQDGAIDITATGGTGVLSYSWITNPASAFSSTDEDLINLDPTTYELTVTDENGCMQLESIGLDTLFIVLANAGPDTALCLNNCIMIQGSAIAPGAVVYEWNTVPTTAPLSDADTVEVCPFGAGITQYTLTVTDANCTHTDTVNVEMYPLPIVNAGTDIEDVLGTTVTLGGAPTGPDGSSYFWSPNTNMLDASGETSSNPQIELIDELDYIVIVTDTNGCVNSDTINVRPIPQIVFPNGFTPNGDGINDDWQIDYIDQFPESVVEVYNRWGQMLFRSVGYTQRWDGRYNGEELPVGTYYYIIELNDPLFPDTYSGPITIMR